MSSNCKILIWTASYPPVLGGLQTVTQQLAQGLAAKGHQVVVLTNRFPQSLPTFEEQEGVKVHRILHLRKDRLSNHPMEYMRFLRNRFLFPASQKSILQVIQDFQPDIINLHFPYPQLPYWDAVREIFNGRLVVSTHGHDIVRWLAKEDERILLRLKLVSRLQECARHQLSTLLNQADALTACSSWMLKCTHLLSSNENTVSKAIHNAVDLSRFEQTAPARFEGFYLFSFGRLAPHKGFDLLIEAFAVLLANHPSLHLIIGGNGQDEQRLRKLADKLGILERVLLPGRLSPEEVVAYAQHARVVVIPSLREPFGISVLEALASNRPVVATNVGGIPEASGGHALLCEPTVAALKRGMTTALEQELSKQEIEARQTYLAEFSVDRFLAQYEQVLTTHL